MCVMHWRCFNHYQEEHEFFDALSQLWYSFPEEFSFESLQNLMFNLFEINEAHSAITDNVDPDTHFLMMFNMVLSSETQIIILKII